MSIIPASIIKTYAESLGIAALPEDVTTALAQDVEYRAREIIQEAAKMMANAKRTKLHVADINNALQVKNVERLYGYDPSEALSFRALPNSGVFYVPREEIDLEAFLQAPLPRMPPPLTLTSHWLAIDGIQPAIPENPNAAASAAFPLAAAAVTPGGSVAAAVKKDAHEDAEIKPLTKHVLSKELQAYYDAIVGDLLCADAERTTSALYAVSSDSGIQQLVPYFVQFVAEAIPKNLRAVARLQTLIGLVKALVGNEHIFIEPYLHQIMPSVLSCLLGKRLCEDPAVEDHWSLREHAAAITATICQRYGNVYGTLIPRVTRTLIKTLLDQEKPLTSHYGAIVGITALGGRTIEAILLPHLAAYMAAIDKVSSSSDDGSSQPKGATTDMADDDGACEDATPAEVERCRGALCIACERWLASRREEGPLLGDSGMVLPSTGNEFVPLVAQLFPSLKA